MKKQVQITIRLSKKLMDELRRQANVKGYVVKDLIVFALQKYINNNEV